MCALKKNTPKKQERGAVCFQSYWLQPFFPLSMINWCVCLSFLVLFTWTVNLSGTGNASLKSCCFPVRHLKSCQSTDGQTEPSTPQIQGKKTQQKQKNTLYVEIQSKYRVNIKNSSKSYPKIWWSSTETVEIHPVFHSSFGQKERFAWLPGEQIFQKSEFKKKNHSISIKTLEIMTTRMPAFKSPVVKRLLSSCRSHLWNIKQMFSIFQQLNRFFFLPLIHSPALWMPWNATLVNFSFSVIYTHFISWCALFLLLTWGRHTIAPLFSNIAGD